MKHIQKLLLAAFTVVFMASCVEDTSIVQDIEGTTNIVEFETYSINYAGLADGSTYDKEFYVKLTGPSTDKITGDITVNLVADESSTATEGDEYLLNTKTITLSKSNDFFGVISITMLSEGNGPPLEGTPEFDAYTAPFLNLGVASVSGASNVVATGKLATINLNFTPQNPYAGDYETEMRYFHPTAGGSHPSAADFDPNDPYGGVRADEKTLVAITGRRCETGYAVWGTTDLCWITVNADNSITFVVDDTWPYDVSLGNPFDTSQESRFDPATRMIYLYYKYEGAGGFRIFWEVFTPLF